MSAIQSRTVGFKPKERNIFFHILTACNLSCQHCYINPEQHGTQTLDKAIIDQWLKLFYDRSTGNILSNLRTTRSSLSDVDPRRPAWFAVNSFVHDTGASGTYRCLLITMQAAKCKPGRSVAIDPYPACLKGRVMGV